MSNLYLDIETYKGPTAPDLSTIEAPANYKDPDKIAAYKLEKQAEDWKRQALVSHRGRIVCAGFARGDDPVTVVTGDEPTILSAVYDVMHFADNFVGHNVGFDLLFLAHRGLAHGIKIHSRIETKKWDKNYTDTMELASFGLQWKYYISLADLCELLGIEKPWGSGDEVAAWYDAGDIDSIVKHCKSDIEATREVYKRLTR